MIPTCTVPMQSKKTYFNNRPGFSTFTLVETMVVIFMVSLFALMVDRSFLGLIRKSTFRGQLQDFVSTMQMAAAAASESDRRYEVIIDLSEQTYLLREITTPQLAEVLDEEIISEGVFNEDCRVAYVEFDDEDYTNDGQAKFRAGHAGWQFGGVIVFTDKDGNAFSVIVNRLGRQVELRDGEALYMLPLEKDEMPF